MILSFRSGPVAQLVRAPPCHGGGRRFEPDLGRFLQKGIPFCGDGIIAQLGEHLPYKQGVIGSSPIGPTICGRVVQLVRMPACHAGGRRFEPVPGRHFLYGGCRQVVKTLGCGSSIRGFESHHPPQIPFDTHTVVCYNNNADGV